MADNDREPMRLDFLDGLRGLMAVYVVLFHAGYFAFALNLDGIGAVVMQIIQFGHYAVDIFIVLSGYCLMIPISRANSSTLTRGFWDYIRRRARRMLPPYYAALVASAVLVLVGFLVQSRGNPGGSTLSQALSPGAILSHLFLVHNLNLDWAYRINGPMWSVATEWQIYFFFPLLLLPICRRLGHIPLIVIALCIGLLPSLLLPFDQSFGWAYPWYLGLFAMGMVCADITLGITPFSRWWHRALATWPVFALCYGLVIIGVLPQLSLIWVNDVLVGVGTMSLITHCISAHKNAGRTLIFDLLNSRIAIWLGSFSYSLYLVHGPIAEAAERLIVPRIHSTGFAIIAMVVVSMAVSLPLAYCFHLLFERPFLNHRRPAPPKVVLAIESEPLAAS